MNLQAENVSWSVEAKQIVDAVTLAVAEGEFVGLLGPNGSGKSSLLRTIYRILQPRCRRHRAGWRQCVAYCPPRGRPTNGCSDAGAHRRL